MATLDPHRLWRLGGVAALVAAVVHVAVLLAGRALGVSFDIPNAPSPIGPVQVVISTIGPFAVGLGGYPALVSIDRAVAASPESASFAITRGVVTDVGILTLSGGAGVRGVG